jgi:putative flippase GtrA
MEIHSIATNRLARSALLAREGWRYLLAVGFATAIDYALLIALTQFAGVYYLLSAAIGFSVGLVINYLLSVNFVFSVRRVQNRRLEFIAFTMIGLLGLGLNEAIMKTCVDALAMSYVLAKIPAIGTCFVFNFSVRRTLLFAAWE